MAQQRTQYANAILPTYRPADAARVIKSRISSVETLNEEISEWFRERARIEETYAAELDKLTRKTIPEIQRAGLFEAVWLGVVRSTKDSAKASGSFASKIHHDIEQPLRYFCAKSPQWADMKVLHDELDTLSHSFKVNDDKLDKLRKKKHGQTEAQQHSLDEVRAQWESQAPYILEQAEVIDESRLGYLKNLLTTFGTIEADRSEKSLKISEGVLNNILSFEPIDDVAAYAAQVSKGGEMAPAPSSHSMRSALSHRPDRPTSISESALGHSTTNQSDGLYEHPQSPQASHASRDDLSSSSKLRSKVGSIFRSSKKKGKAAPPPPASLSPAASRARYRSSNGASAPVRGSVSEIDTSGPLGAPASATALRKPPPPPARKANGTGNVPPLSASYREQSHSSFDNPTSPVTLSAPPRNSSALPPVGNNSVPDEPEEDRSLVDVPPTVQEEAEEEDKPTRPFQIDIKQEAINDTKDDDDVALSVIASTLRQRNTISGRGQRGRREIQSTLFTNIPPSAIEEAGNAPSMPPPVSGNVGTIQELAETSETAPVERSVGATEAGASPSADVHSVLSESPSTVPTSSVFGTSLIHPVLPSEPGINASIVEVVSSVVTDGAVTRAHLVGEIAFNHIGGERPQGVNVRVGNLGIFDILTPNDAFVRAVDASTGLYNLNTDSIIRSNGLGFKFVSQNAQSFVPVDFSPIWRIEKNQSSLMLAYKVANSFLRESPVVLHDLVVTVPLEGGVATSAVSKPHAVFNKAKQHIVWKLTDPVVIKAGFEDRLLCRFTTEGPARESAAGIEIKFRMVTPGRKVPSEVVSGDESAGHQVVLDFEESENSWKSVNSVVSVSSGKFSVHSEHSVQNNF